MRTRLPWDVSKPVRVTTARTPPSGACSSCFSLGWVVCNTFVPPYSKEFLSRPVISRISLAARRAILSLSSGVDSPDNIASFTIQPPAIKIASHGSPESSFVRTTEIKSPGNNSSEGTSTHLLSR